MMKVLFKFDLFVPFDHISFPRDDLNDIFTGFPPTPLPTTYFQMVNSEWSTLLGKR